MKDTEVRLWLNYCLKSKIKTVLTIFPKLLNILTEEQKISFNSQIIACQERLSCFE